MSFFIDFIQDSYNEILLTRKNKYELEKWMFMSSPTPLLITISAYLYFVLYYGPKFMKNREPFKLNKIIIIYNALQVILCTWLFSRPLYVENGLKYLSQPCNTNFGEPLDREIEYTGWWVFFSKMLDLLDTVFFVLRKKQSHVTFLHVYHHTIMAVSSWVYVKYIPGQQLFVPGWVNIFVHIFMYTYYLLSALGPEYQKYLWWKKYMTKLQLIQFIFVIFYLITLVVMECKVQKLLTLYTFINVVIFLVLFYNFYQKSYSTTKKNIHKE